MLWGLPPTFCSLVQRAGRAGRNLAMDGEAILIVPKSALREDPEEIAQAAELVRNTAAESEALDREATNIEALQTSEILDEEGIRVMEETEDAEELLPLVEAPVTRVARRKRFQAKNSNIHETRALFAFVRTKSCRREVWNAFFKNADKCESNICFE